MGQADSRKFYDSVYQSPSGDGKEARRRVLRVVGIGVGLLQHDGEVEGVLVKDDAMLKRISQNDEVTKMFQVYFSAGCCDMRNLSAPFARP